nr:immunoglobulin light chain junction region [Macaca mulatta]
CQHSYGAAPWTF